LARAGDVFAYFNNDWEAFAVKNAEQLERLLAAGWGAREAGA